MGTYYHIQNMKEMIETHGLKRTGMALAKGVKIEDVLDMNQRLRDGIKANRKKKTFRTMKLPNGASLSCEWIETFAATKTTTNKIRICMDRNGSFFTLANWEPDRMEVGPPNAVKEKIPFPKK